MGAQLGFALLVGIGKGALVARRSTLPRGSRDPNVGLHLLLAVNSGLDHRGLVHVVGDGAFALEWALASQPLHPWAVAAPLLLLGNSCGQHLLVVLGHHRSSTFSENQTWLLSTQGRRSATIALSTHRHVSSLKC